MLKDKPGRKLTEYVEDYVLFDLETTGLSPENDTIIEISALKVVKREVVAEFSTLVNPERKIPYHITDLTGIDDKMVADAPKLDKALADFLEFAGDNVLVGHNIHRFDMKFMYAKIYEYYGKVIGNDYIDTLDIAYAYLPKLSHRTLTDLAEYYHVEIIGAHRALNDCIVNRQVFEKLAEEMEHPLPEAQSVKRCPKCGSFLKLRSGAYGEFLGCTGYPNCRYTENIRK